MQKQNVLSWFAAAVGLLFPASLSAAHYADVVEAYDPGTGFATEFGTGLGFTNASAVLGEPNRNNSFAPITPFNPPFDRTELTSLGVGGHLVVRMAAPVQDVPGHLYGLDFIIYGSAGFLDVDYPNGQTDEFGSLFGHNPGLTRVSVSQDNVLFFTLDPALVPVVDGLYPTDGRGAFGLPVDPSLEPSDFANQDLAGLELLYAGSAGGTGFDLAWARDEQGQPVDLDSIQYIRVDVLSGRAEIDGFALVPEPSTTILLLAAGICVGIALVVRSAPRGRTPAVTDRP